MSDANFQSESKKTGDAFEELVYADLVSRGYSDIQPNVYIEGAGCEIDFLASDHPWDKIEYVEAKGGLDGNGKRPGAKRTDNVKKAIANGSLIKALHPEIYYVVYFSSTPSEGYSSEMIYTALKYKIIDEVRYI
jgi:hypothetical protein